VPLQLLSYYVALARGCERGQAAQSGQECDRGVIRMMPCRPAARLSPYRLLRLPLAGAVLVGSLVSGQDKTLGDIPPPPSITIKPFAAAPMLLVAEEPGWSPDQTPADFLEGIGRRVKARWRQLYRDAPPPPSTARPVSAFTLGSLMADSFLTLQALDAQQFRNNNQDVLELLPGAGLQ